MKSQNIVLYRSKKKLLALLAGTLLLVIGCLWELFRPHEVLILLFDSAGLLLFTWVGIGLVSQLFVAIPILIINDEGIQNGYTTIKWEEIALIQRFKLYTVTYLGVILSPEGMQAFLARMPHQRRASALLLQFTGIQPELVLAIPQVVLPITVKQVITRIQESYQARIEDSHILLRT